MANQQPNPPLYSGHLQIGRPGVNPNYKRLILTDPAYHQTAQNVAAQNDAADATLTGALQSGAVNQGSIPDLQTAATQLGLSPDSALYKALAGVYNDPNIQSAATNNPFSTQANADYAHKQNLGGILDNLGSRGGYQQGAYGSAATSENRRYGESNQANVLSYLTGIQHAFDTHTQAQTTGANTLATAASSAADRQAKLNPVIPGTGIYAGGLTPARVLPGLNMPKTDTTWAPPRFGVGAGYAPNGTVAQTGALTGNVTAPSGGTYGSGGGNVTFQSNQGPAGSRPLA